MSSSHLKDPVPERHFTYLVIMPDVLNGTRCDPELRQKHVENSKAGWDNGRIIDAAAWYAEDPAKMDREPTLSDMRGSIQMVRAGSMEEVRQKFSQDVYVTGGAWDISKMQIYPIINRPLK